MPLETTATAPDPNAWRPPAAGAIQAPLALTRRGLLLIHWGIQLTAALLLVGVLLGVLQMTLHTGLTARWLQWWIAARIPVQLLLQVMIGVGIVLLTAGPQPTRGWAWTLLAVSAIGAVLYGAVRVAIYRADGPAALAEATEGFAILSGLFYAAWAHRFCRWMSTIGGDDAPSLSAIRGGLTWKRLAGSMNVVFWIIAIGGLLVSAPLIAGFLVGLLLPYFAGADGGFAIMAIIAAGGLLMVAGAAFLVLAIVWVANRTHWINRRLQATVAEPVIGPIAALPPERLGRVAPVLGALAAVGLGIGLWADQVLAPAAAARQLAAALEGVGDGGAAAETLDLPAPEITLTPLSGPPVTLAELRGRVVLLNFYATWCPPCVAEIPSLARLAREHGEEALVVVGISDEDAATIRDHAAPLDIPYRLVSGSGWPAPFNEISAVPTTFLIDRDGIIRRRIVGARSHAVFEKLIDEVIAGPAAAPATAPSIPLPPDGATPPALPLPAEE